ncbi:MAG: Glycosyl transferase, group 2 family protein [uncultured Sulfurovum sp.]|uniref:Glycosyl transferase, group 2 family protein n=1 Tax=uncultured Sulfurovum sp. TaxID=269237 RepID=A0A6S6U529_9BACT|nr:MAG: Glycosyl transferase, group 2 family protein [uncultured Sulfurovum sp.]
MDFVGVIIIKMKKILFKSFKILQKTFYLVRYDGIVSITYKSYHRYVEGGRKAVTKGINIRYKLLLKENTLRQYEVWMNTVEKRDKEKRDKEKKHMDYNPLISILMPTYNTHVKWLEQAIDSVLAQDYTHWELCIADDASTLKSTLTLLKKYDKKYPNIKIIYRSENGHISKASNDALGLATGEYVTFLDHDDTLAPFALREVVKIINKNRAIELIYSDEDKIDEENRRFEPHFKSDWNPDMFFSQNYLSHLSVIKTDIIFKTEHFRVGYEGSQDYDLILQCLKFIESKNIYHIPKILYHWRAIEGSTAKESTAKSYTTEAGIKALEACFKNDKGVTICQGLLPNTFKVDYPIIDEPLVSIIIPTKDNYQLLFQCISSILEKTLYRHYEIIIVDNQTSQKEALDYLEALSSINNITILKYEYVFNYAKINNYAVRQAKGDYVAFLNNDIEIINTLWLNEMLQHAQRKEIGIVGAKLYYEDMSIQHAGVILGIGGIAGHAHKYFDEEAHGYFSRLKIIQNYSALTAACIVIKKSIFKEVGGFEETLEVAFNDIDLSLKVLEKGYRNLWTPYAQLIHHESKSRGLENTPEKKARFDREILFMKEKWGVKLLEDKCYNPNLTLEHEDFSLKIEERN